MTKQIPDPDILYQMRDAAFTTVALLAAMELNIFTPLEDGPLNTEQLASELDINAQKLGPLLYALVTTGLLTEESGAFSNTVTASEFLVKGKPGYRGEAHKIWSTILRASLETAETVRNGVPQAKVDWTKLSQSELKSKMEGLSPQAVAFARWAASHFDFSQFQRLLDAGGGSGSFAITMAEIHPHLEATVVDLPQVTPITEQFINEAGASQRVTALSADLVRAPIPGRYDVAVIGAVLHTLSAEEARSVIRNVGKVVEPGGWLYIYGRGILANSRLSPKSAVEWSLFCINAYDGGQSYTEGEHREWLQEAGFRDITFKFEESFIAARKQVTD